MAYRIRQGYVRQGQGNGRVVTPEQFAHKINQYVELFPPVLFGSITLDPNAIYRYGLLQKIQLDEKKAQWIFVFRHAETNEQTELGIPFSAITLTHDVEFTIDDEKKGSIPYPVFYVTTTDKKAGRSVTYYMASESLVSRPLDCIAEFYLRSREYGKDMELQQQLSCRWTPPTTSL